MSKAAGITLKPVRMSDIAQDAPVAVVKPGSSGYLPPHMRTAATVEAEQPDLGTKNFPSLGSAVSAKSLAKEVKSFKGAADTAIEKEKTDAAASLKLPEQDIMKMTTEELLTAGWVVLPKTAARIKALCNDLGNHVGIWPEPQYSDYSQVLGASLCEEYLKEADEEMDEYRPRAERHTMKARAPHITGPLDAACLRAAKVKTL